MNELSVRLYGLPVGTLIQDETGKMAFTYCKDAAQPVSLGMPLQEEPYDHTRCVAFFGGLLPESAEARKAIARQYGANANNDFSLLRAIGYECAGAISLHALEEPITERKTEFVKARILPDKELAQHIRELPKKPLFLGVDGIRLSLAGAQEKAAVCLMDGAVGLPQEGSPTTHILKPAIAHLQDSVSNEYFCMRLAQRVGLDVPEVSMHQAEDVPYLLIKRYDRELLEGDKLARLHQEDFCQALGVPAALKYQSDGGPSLQDCFDLLRRTSRPIPDRNRLAELVVFNYLIGNRDAHGKNFSLLHTGQVRLAPAYDLLCAAVYDVKKMAMKIGGYYEDPKLLPRHWERFSKEVGFSYPALKKTLLRQSEGIVSAAEQERQAIQASGWEITMADEVLRFLRERCAQVRKQFS